MTVTLDFLIGNEGSVFTVTPLTPEALAYLRQHFETEGWQWLGHTLAVDHRYISDIVLHLQEEGYEVR